MANYSVNHGYFRSFAVFVAFVFLFWTLLDDNWFKAGACHEGIWRLCCNGFCSKFDGNGELDAVKWLAPMAVGFTGLLFVLSVVHVSTIVIEVQEGGGQFTLRAIVSVIATALAITYWSIMYHQRKSAILDDNTDAAYAFWVSMVAWVLLAIDVLAGNCMSGFRLRGGDYFGSI